MVIFSGCSSPSTKIGVLAHPARVSSVIIQQPQGITIPYGSIAAVYTSTNGAMKFQDIGPTPINITNDVSKLKDGQFAISSVIWAPGFENVTVTVHADNWEDYLGEGTGWGKYWHWTLWASLDLTDWVQMDCKATFNAQDVQFNAPYNQQGAYFRVTRE